MIMILGEWMMKIGFNFYDEASDFIDVEDFMQFCEDYGNVFEADSVKEAAIMAINHEYEGDIDEIVNFQNSVNFLCASRGDDIISEGSIVIKRTYTYEVFV